MTERNREQAETTPSARTVLGRIYLLVALVAAVVVCSMTYVYLTNSHIVAERVRWINATLQIRLEATAGHLWFEEIISGDRSETLDHVLERLTNAERYAEATLVGGDTPSGKVRPLDDADLRAKMGEVRDKLAQFRQTTMRRWEAEDESGIGSAIDQEYDAVYDSFVRQAQEVEGALQQSVAAEFRRAKVVQMLLIGICLTATIAVGSALGHLVRRRLCVETSLRTTNRELELSNRQLHDKEKQLRASNQQLDAGNQQLRASEQQLRAANQQLRAAEQQLRASNQQLAASNQQLRASQEEIWSLAKFPSENPDPVLRIAADGIVHYANQPGARLLAHFNTQVGSEIPPSWGVSVADVLAGAVRQEVEIQAQGCTYLLAFASIPEGRYVNVYARDISARVQAEAVVRCERDRAQSYLDIAGVVLVALDNRGRVTLMNKKGCALLGWEEGEVLGKDWFATYVPAPERPDVERGFRELIQGHLEPVEYFENSVLTRDGSSRTIAWHNTILHDPTGQVVGTLSSGEDVTDRKRAEAQLREHQRQLRSLVSQLTTTEERGRKELAGVLHDGFIQNLALCKMRLEQARAAGTPCKVRSILDGAIEGILELITEMRTVTFELCSPVLYTVGLEAAIQDWLDNHVQGKHDTEFVYEDDGQRRDLEEGLSFFLFRATRELCTNIIKHARADTAEVSVRTENGMVRIDVKDDGTGMTSSGGGEKADERPGLGLFSIRERLDHFGGTMHVNTSPGAGTHVTILAPLTER